MFPIVFGRHTTGSIRWGLTAATAAVFIIALLIWLNRIDSVAHLPGESPQSDIKPKQATSGDHQHASADKRKQTQPSFETPLPEQSYIEPELMRLQQAQAARAAIKAKPIDGNVSQRPEFVSEVEWEVLKDAAGNNPEVEKQLTHLVNKLLFYKKREAWIAPTTDANRRRVLAGELLAMLPAQVDKNAVDPAFAEKLERDLRNYLDSETD